MLLLIACLLMVTASASADDLSNWKKHVDPWLQRVEQQPDWLYSRLQMYWTTHATEVYINGENFDHPGGERAPEPTLKMNGCRSTGSSYNRPRLENVVPYDDDSLGSVTYISKKTGQMERAIPANTGCNINSLNHEIVSIARDAARIYGKTGDKRYADLALGVLSTYMKGIYYRQPAIDLNHGQQQTLVGYATFEVIHEDCAADLAETYTLLGSYVKTDRDIIEAAFKKWADVIIAHGVPHNNWDLFQAETVLHIAMALADDSHYADRHGKQYYIDNILHKQSIRQWGLRQLADFGFDAKTGIWYEAPGYSTTVVRDFCSLANEIDSVAGVDVFADIPVLKRAITAQTQYLFPNRIFAGFGDSHPTYLSTAAYNAYLAYARRHHLSSEVSAMTQARQAILPDAPAASLGAYASPLFYAPNVSWSVIRSGFDKQHDLMVSINGSLGNHQHANGISMELYGKGWVLGPDAGIGRTLYSGLDYAEYYSQFPAHNTVCVNGISSYAVMMSNHPFRMLDQRQVPLQGSADFAGCQTVSFHEPEANADQLRTNAVVKVGEVGGYYVDIFRSRCQDSVNTRGQREFHDYFYHNLGQEMTLSAADGADLSLQPTDQLAFAGGCLYAYSYLYDKKSADTDRDVRATFTIHPREGATTLGDIYMTMWMAGSPDRTVFSALSPVNLQYERMPNQPYDIGKQPVQTFVTRQQGEAWDHPFVAVFEPTATKEPSVIRKVSFFKPESTDSAAVGIKVELLNGHVDYVFSSATAAAMTYDGMSAKGYCEIIRR